MSIDEGPKDEEVLDDLFVSDRFIQLRIIHMSGSTPTIYGIMPVYGPGGWTGVAIRDPDNQQREKRDSLISDPVSTIREAVHGALGLILEREGFSNDIELTPSDQIGKKQASDEGRSE